jgi:hypothetical protein
MGVGLVSRLDGTRNRCCYFSHSAINYSNRILFSVRCFHTSPPVTASNCRRSLSSVFSTNSTHTTLQRRPDPLQASISTPSQQAVYPPELLSRLRFRLRLNYGRQSVGQYVLAHDENIPFLFLIRKLDSKGGRPLWREDGSVICIVLNRCFESHRTQIYFAVSCETGFPFCRLLRLAETTVDLF